MQIHELPTSGVSDTDKLAFDTGANTYSGTFSSIAASVLSKLTSQTFSALTTTAKTVIGAINELKTALSNTSLVTTFTSLTFSALNTSNKTLPGAINELNYKQTDTRSGSFTATLSGVSGAQSILRTGKMCRMHFVLGDGTAFSSATGFDTVGTVPDGYRPRFDMAQGIVDARTVGGWAAASHYICIIRVDTGGAVSIVGNANQIRSCQYISGDIIWGI